MTGVTLANKFLALTIFTALLCGICRCDQPPYQVSLFIHLHPKGPPMHLCNGAIVQSKLILTTAACVHYLLIPDKPIIPVHPSMLSVVAGSTNAFNDALILKVAEIIFHKDFNETTMTNDLALLRLSTSLPLSSREDIKWIILDEYSPKHAPCLANFHVRNSMDKVPDYTQTEELEILNITECLKYSSYPNARKQDICSKYILPQNFKCNNFNEFIPFNGDRGTGLICNSHLVGLLSSILPLEDNPDNNCSEKLVKAFYTYIGSYIEWAYDIIAQEEYAALSEEDYSASAPYDQDTEAIIVSTFTETVEPESSTSPRTTFTETKSPTTQSTTPLTTVPAPSQAPLHKSDASKLLVVSFELLLLLLSVQIF